MSAERLELDELVEQWTLLDGERELVAGKRGTTRLVFALMLKFYGCHGRFPDADGDLPREVVEFVARQVGVAPADIRRYEFSGRTVEYHRAQIRGHFGFRECTVEDAQAIERWLAEHVARADPRQDVGVSREFVRKTGLGGRRAGHRDLERSVGGSVAQWVW